MSHKAQVTAMRRSRGFLPLQMLAAFEPRLNLRLQLDWAEGNTVNTCK